MTFTIGIVGTGPAGLTVALALEQATSEDTAIITLIDRNKDAVDYPGIEYGIQARACEALDRLGLKEHALRTGHETHRLVFHRARQDEDQFEISSDPEKTFGVLRQEFLETLNALVRRAQTLREHNVTQARALEHGRVQLLFGGEDYPPHPPLDFDLVVATDGANSVIRKQYFPQAGTQDRGFSAIYLLIAPETPARELPADFVALANGPLVHFARGDKATNIFFPQGRNRMTIALNFDHETGERIWRSHALKPGTPWKDIPAQTKKAIALTLARDTPSHDDVMARALELVPDWNSPHVYQWHMRDSDPLEAPYAPDCNLVLVGDSCHAFLPTIGMGASLAIEDGQILGSALGRYLETRKDRPIGELALRQGVFEPFVRDRRATWNDLMERARAAVINFTGQDERSRFRRAPYVPTRIGSGLVGIVEDIAEKVGDTP